MSRGPAIALVLLGATLFAAGCGGARRGEPVTKPLVITDPMLAAGERVFMIHCHQCHPGGAAGLGPGINDKPLPGAMIRLQVRRGLGAMPAFDDEHISDAELDTLIAYLRELRRHGG